MLERDEYAIYSVMLSNPETSHGPDTNARYLIEETTGPGTPKEPCVNPPPEYKERFLEVLKDFERRRNTPRLLKRGLSISKPYLLLKPDDVRKFRTPSHPEKDREPFLGVQDLFTLTDVYFNNDRTLALTAISSWCGGLCGLFQWKVFEKGKDGNWEEKRWVSCITIARSYRAELSILAQD